MIFLQHEVGMKKLFLFLLIITSNLSYSCEIEDFIQSRIKNLGVDLNDIKYDEIGQNDSRLSAEEIQFYTLFGQYTAYVELLNQLKNPPQQTNLP